MAYGISVLAEEEIDTADIAEGVALPRRETGRSVELEGTLVLLERALVVTLLVVDLLGLILVAGIGLGLDRRLRDRAKNWLVSAALGLLVWPVCLILLQILVAVFAFCLGWPVGE